MNNPISFYERKKEKHKGQDYLSYLLNAEEKKPLQMIDNREKKEESA